MTKILIDKATVGQALRSIRELVVDESEHAPALQGARMRKQASEKALREALAEQPAQHREAAVIDSIIAEHGYPKEFQEFAAQLNARKAEQPAQEPVVFEIDWPEYNSHAMGCGLEDRGITSRYEAMQYGWDEALERMAECLPDELYTSPPAQRERCHLCDCTGDIHSPDGEWRGECPYCKQQAQRKPLTPEQVNRMAEVHAIDGDARHWFVVGLTDGEAAHGIKGDA